MTKSLLEKSSDEGTNLPKIDGLVRHDRNEYVWLNNRREYLCYYI